MLNNIGVPGLILILVVALVIFGPNKLPEVGRAFGKSIREFKNATSGLADEIKSGINEDINAAKAEAKAETNIETKAEVTEIKEDSTEK